jgi:hypothetical protein
LVQRPLRHAVVVDRYGCVRGVLLSVLLRGPGCGDREPNARVNVVVDGRCSGVVGDGRRRRLERTCKLNGQRKLDVDSLGLVVPHDLRPPHDERERLARRGGALG